MGEYLYRVVTTAPVTPVIRELWLTPSVCTLTYRAGQYVLLSDTAHRLPPRAYSIANAPCDDGRISLLVTRFPGGRTSAWVHSTLKPGSEVVIDGPYGTFLRNEGDGNPVLLLAAGSGLAPIRALAEVFLRTDYPRCVTLFLSVRTVDDAVDRERFESLERIHHGFHFLLTMTRDPTALRNQRIPKLLPVAFTSLRGWSVFIAGPTGFVVGCAAAAVTLGAAATAVQTEEFFADPQPWINATPCTSAFNSSQ